MKALWVMPLVTTLLFHCTEQALGNPQRLNSGKIINVETIGPIIGNGWSGLKLRYQSETAIDDVPALRLEADELWNLFVVNVEHGGYTSAIISAEQPHPESGTSSFQSYNSTFEKKNGIWRTNESKDRIKIDDKFVRDFVMRLSSFDQNNELNAILLYLSEGFNITLSNEQNRSAPVQTLNRQQFLNAEEQFRKTFSNYHHAREILSVAISADGTHADVLSREKNEVDAPNGHHVSNSIRDTDSFELQGPYMLWTKSDSVIEKETDSAGN